MYSSFYPRPLIGSGDVFDEADFNVGEGEYPDGIVAEDTQRRHQPPTPVGRPNAHTNLPKHALGAPASGNQHVVTPSKPERPINPAPAARQIPNQALNNRPFPPPAQNHYTNQRQSVPLPDSNGGLQNGRSIPPGQRASNGMATGSDAGAQVPIKQEHGAKQPNPAPQNTAVPATPGINGQGPPVVGFLSARGADMLRENPHSAATVAPAFNPHAESPSIRKTAGVDHTKSVPISKPMLAGSASPASNQTRDFINPSAEMHRKIGAPSGGVVGSPLNRGPSVSSYRPLTRPNVDPKAAAQNNTAAANRMAPNMNGKRPPLNDVTNASLPGGNGCTPAPGLNDPKRAKYDESMSAQQHQQQHQH